MKKVFNKTTSYGMALAACSILAMTSGCASGGFKLTREYASWLNSQNIILRVVLYLLTGIVFVVTLLIDVVVNNTVDFWDGRVSAGSYEFKDGDKIFQAKHEYLPETHLRRSTILVLDSKHKQLQQVVLNETPNHEIEMFVDGNLRARVNHLSELPVASVFDKNGKLVQEEVLVLTPNVAKVAAK